MKPDEFCRWLQGFAELNDKAPTEAQWKSIREHLQTVFEKVTPPVDHEKPAKDLAEAVRRGDFSPTRIC